MGTRANAVDLFNSLVNRAQSALSTGSNDSNIGAAQQASIARQEQNDVIRDGWFMTTTEWITGSNPRGIYWAANPGDVTWKMGQRSTHGRNLYGTVLHVWPDNYRQTLYDEFRLTLNLQSGNLMPILRKDGRWTAPGGIMNFYDLMQLIDAPKLTTGTATEPPRANLVQLHYKSSLFPQLTLFGMFESDGISFTDMANNPHKVNSWSVSFLVYDSAPRLTSSEGSQTTNSALLGLWIDQRINKAQLKR